MLTIIYKMKSRIVMITITTIIILIITPLVTVTYASSSSYDGYENRRYDNDASIRNRANNNPPLYTYKYDETRSSDNNPIDYNFKSNDDENEVMYESAKVKRDLLTRYTSSKIGKMKVALSSMLLGYGFGMMIRNMIPLPNNARSMSVGVIFAGCALGLNFIRTVYSDLLRSLALVMILTVTKTRDIRRRYPTLPHIKSILRPSTCSRVPFPYDGNPWQYNGGRFEEFNMLYTALALGLVGGVVGGNIPLVPTFLGGPLGCAAFAFAATLQDAKGDLARSMGMKVVAAVEELIFMQSELSIVSKTMTVANRILDKLLILDRKHRIKDKIIRFVQWGYDKTMNTISEAQASTQSNDSDEIRRPRPDDQFSDERQRPLDENRNQNAFPRDEFRRQPDRDDNRGSRDEERRLQDENREKQSYESNAFQRPPRYDNPMPSGNIDNYR